MGTRRVAKRKTTCSFRNRRSCRHAAGVQAMKEPKKLDRCFVNGSRPTGKILVSWCENTKTYKAVRYFGNEQLTTLSTANRACEVRVMLGKAAASDKVRALAGRTKNKKKRDWSRTLANVFRRFSRRCRKTQKSPRIPRLLEGEF